MDHFRAGPIMAALAGVGVGGAIGGIAGALIGMGIPEYEAKRYEGRIKEGGILLSVHCDSSEWTKKAKTILKATGADDISSIGETAGLLKNRQADAACKLTISTISTPSLWRGFFFRLDPCPVLL